MSGSRERPHNPTDSADRNSSVAALPPLFRRLTRKTFGRQDPNALMSDNGTCYFLNHNFGQFEVAPLLRALRDHLPKGSEVQFVAPIHLPIQQVLAEHGRRVRSARWALQVGADAAVWTALADVAEARCITELCVWLLGTGPNKEELIETEDGNDYIWLGDAVARESQLNIVESASGYTSMKEYASPVP